MASTTIVDRDSLLSATWAAICAHRFRPAVCFARQPPKLGDRDHSQPLRRPDQWSYLGSSYPIFDHYMLHAVRWHNLFHRVAKRCKSCVRALKAFLNSHSWTEYFGLRHISTISNLNLTNKSILHQSTAYSRIPTNPPFCSRSAFPCLGDVGFRSCL